MQKPDAMEDSIARKQIKKQRLIETSRRAAEQKWMEGKKTKKKPENQKNKSRGYLNKRKWESVKKEVVDV